MRFIGIVELKGVVKRFGDLAAVDGIDIDIKKGEVYGILGPNGAGKTTAINMILGLLNATGGSIRIDGMNIRTNKHKIKEIIGFMTQETVVDQDLTAENNLRIIAELYHLSDEEVEESITNALRESDLVEFAKVKAGTFSGGMQRRLNLVRSMMHNPKILILDEPTTGLDVQNRLGLWKRIKKLNDNGMTIILTTQYLEEADALCDNIAIIDHGKIIAAGTPSELKRKAGSGDVLEITAKISDIDKIKKMLVSKFRLNPESTSDKVTAMIAKNAIRTLARVTDEIERQKISIISIGLHLPTLDDVFIKLTGSTMRDSLGKQKSNFSSAMVRRR